jgi:hypothetical protein
VEVTEIEPGLGQEAVDKAGPVLHPSEPGGAGTYSRRAIPGI